MTVERRNRVFIGGISDRVQKEDIEKEFGRFGKLTSIWVAQNPPGFAFVEYDHISEADMAVSEMNGKSFGGSSNKIRVEHSHGGGRSRSRRGGFDRDSDFGGRGRDRFGSGGFRDGGSGGYRRNDFRGNDDDGRRSFSNGGRFGGSSGGRFGGGGGGGGGSYRNERSYARPRSRSPPGRSNRMSDYPSGGGYANSSPY